MVRKISVTTGTRAEYGILRPILHAISKSKKLELQLIVTGTHLSKKHGYTINDIKKDGFKIAATIPMIPKGDTNYFMSKAVGEAIVKFSNEFLRLKPDINLILGDRDEMLASAIAAYHMNIPNAHLAGGDQSGGIDEYTRHAITKISNIHFTTTKKSRERVIRMGEDPKYVFFTGSPAIDELAKNKITNQNELERRYHIRFQGDEIILLQHPVTTQVECSEKQIINTLKAIVKAKKITIVIAPNSDAGSRKICKYLESYSRKYEFIRMYKTLPRADYLGLLRVCGVLVGNSSSGMVEAGFFNIPVVNIGIRQKNRERMGKIFDVRNNSVDSIYSSIMKALYSKRRRKKMKKPIFGIGNSSYKIIHYLENIPLSSSLIHKQITY